MGGMSVKELKKTITKAGLSHEDCFEKSELRVRAIAAMKRLASSPLSCRVDAVLSKVRMGMGMGIFQWSETVSGNMKSHCRTVA